VIIALAALALTACGSSSKSSSSSSGAQKVALVIKKDGCAGTTQTLVSGPYTFDVSNDGAAGITEIEVKSNGHIVGEKEDLTPGLSGSFNLTLKEGTYDVVCPGGSDGKITVTAAATSSTT
jgi:iron uptake system component EfeO